MHYSDEELRYIMQSHMQNATNNIVDATFYQADDNMFLNGSKRLRPFRKDNKLKVTHIRGLVWRSSLPRCASFSKGFAQYRKPTFYFILYISYTGLVIIQMRVMRKARNYLSEGSGMAPEDRRPIGFIVGFITICLFIALNGCTDRDKAEPPAKERISIAAVLPLTGPKAVLGAGEKDAIELAVKDMNGVNDKSVIQVIFVDSKDDPVEATQQANNLLRNNSVSAFITSGISVSRALLPLVTKNKKTIAMLCADPTIQQMSPYAFRLYQSMADESEQLLKYYSLTGNKKKVVIFFSNRQRTAFQVSNYLIPGFMKEGIRILYYEPYDADEKDFRPRIERLKLSGADSLLILGSGVEYPTILGELSKSHLLGKMEVVGGWGFLVSSGIPVEFTEGIIVAGPQYIFKKNEKARLFEDRYVKIYGQSPNSDSALAYDAAQILSEGLAKGLIEGKGNAETVSYLITNHKFSGVAGELSVDNEGGLKVPMGIGIVKHGRIEPYAPAGKID